MSTQHTPEPWEVHEHPQRSHHYGVTIGDGPTSVIATATSMKDARRIVACVNACKGINPEAVPDLLEALKVAMKSLATYGRHPLIERQANAAIAKAQTL